MTEARAVHWPDYLPLLKETHKIWSAGLTFAHYVDYNASQRVSAWGRRHLSLLCLYDTENEKEILSSLKLYKLTLKSRGQDFFIYGIGAMYTPQTRRQKGYGQALLLEVIKKAEEENVDGLLLFSDIGEEFYEQVGFELIGGASFTLQLPRFGGEDLEACPPLKALEESDVPFVERHYKRWLHKRPYAVERAENYWRYKISKEKYLQANSKLSWPGLSLLKLVDGYAILEKAGATLRILELIHGSGQCALEKAWSEIFAYCASQRIRRLTGWEGVLFDLAPAYRLDKLAAALCKRPLQDFHLYFEDRGWGAPMLLPLNEKLESWCEIAPCPILELDHL